MQFSCLGFEEIPCAHACAVILGLNLDIYAFVSDYYFSSTLLSTYKGSVYPIGNHSDWSSIDVDVNVLPPLVKQSWTSMKTKNIVNW